jgi:hypothetical protein
MEDIMSKLKTLFRALQACILIPSIAYTSISYAFQVNYNIDAYAGAEPTFRKMIFKKNFGSNIFKDPLYTEINVFIGCKINKHFGVEAAYEFSDSKVQSKNAHRGLFLFGNKLIHSATGFDSVTNSIHARSKIDGFNINLIGYLPIVTENVNLIGLAGVGYLRSNTMCNLTEIGETNILLEDGLNVPVQRCVLTEGRYKNRIMTIRASMGIQYLINKNFGIRALAGWENTHKIKIQGKDTSTRNKVNEYAKFKDSVMYRIGFFVPF